MEAEGPSPTLDRGGVTGGPLRPRHRLTVDVAGRRMSAGGRDVELTGKEFDLMVFLCGRPGQVFSRDELLRAVWHSAPGWQSGSTVTEHVHRLRAKIELDPLHPQMLRTVRGMGYRYDPAGVDGEEVDPAGFEGRQVVDDSLRALLRIGSAAAAAEVLQAAAIRLGALVAAVGVAAPDHLDVDLALGCGPPVVAVTPPASLARRRVEALIPALACDAREAIGLLRRVEVAPQV